MREGRHYVVAIALLLCLGIPASADVQCASGIKFTPLEVRPVTLHFRHVPIRTLFGAIETLTGTRFAVPAELDYRVTYDIRNVPACRALEIIGEGLSLTYRQDDETIVVVAPEPLPPPVRPSPTPKE